MRSEKRDKDDGQDRANFKCSLYDGEWMEKAAEAAEFSFEELFRWVNEEEKRRIRRTPPWVEAMADWA